MSNFARRPRSVPPLFPRPGRRARRGTPLLAGLIALGTLGACESSNGGGGDGDEAGNAGVSATDTAGAGQGALAGANGESGSANVVAGAAGGPPDETAGAAGDNTADPAGAPSSGGGNEGVSGNSGTSGNSGAGSDMLDAGSTPPDDVDSGTEELASDAATSDSGAASGLDDNGVSEMRQLLSQTGLYADMTTQALAPGVAEYQPQFELWSDSATKRRYLYIPDGSSIDTSDIDEWEFPVGTKIWKEFTRDGVRVETRLLEKLPDDRLEEGLDRWLMLAYVWNEDQTDALATPLGLENASGTEHDVPDTETCNGCHNARREKPLGVSAVQLSHSGPGLTLDALLEQGLASDAPPTSLQVPGDELERFILGYLHANCGHCHRNGARANSRVRSLRMWLESESLESVETTETYTSLVNAYTESADGSLLPLRISGQDEDGSELMRRILLRDGTEGQMPPLGTELVDEDTVARFREWIATLPPVL